MRAARRNFAGARRKKRVAALADFGTLAPWFMCAGVA